MTEILVVSIKLILVLHIVILYSICNYLVNTDFHNVYGYTIQKLASEKLAFPYYITVFQEINIKKNAKFGKLTLAISILTLADNTFDGLDVSACL